MQEEDEDTKELADWVLIEPSEDLPLKATATQQQDRTVACNHTTTVACCANAQKAICFQESSFFANWPSFGVYDKMKGLR